MSTVVAFSLPWGRYHATPWDRNVNEGAVEWPPSPWRILRALYATWKLRCPDLADDQVLPLLQTLAEPPTYHVPSFCLGHTRHYLPGAAHMEGVKGKNKTDKTFDPFVATKRDAALLVEWAATLDEQDQQTLDALLAQVSYLGRAESIVDAERWDEQRTGATLADGGHELIAPGSGPQRLLTPTVPLDEQALTATPHGIRSERRLDPPATRWVSYPQPKPSTDNRTARTSPSVGAEAVRFSIIGSSPGARTSAVAFGDALRQNCLRAFGEMYDGRGSAQLAGKSDDGGKALGPHAHAHYFAFSATGDQRTVDTVAVWSRAGLDPADVLAIARNLPVQLPPRLPDVEDVRGKWLGLEGFGSTKDVLPELCGAARTWHTYTPYAMTKHWKGPIERQLTRDLDAELATHGLDARVEYVDLLKGNWLDYRRRRLFKNPRLADSVRAYGLQVGFTEDVSGPLALGALSHFGLGLFLPGPVAKAG